MTGVTADSFSLEIATWLPEELRQHLEKTKQLQAESGRTQTEAATETRITARQLVDAGLSLRDVGKLLGLARVWLVTGFREIHNPESFDKGDTKYQSAVGNCIRIVKGDVPRSNLLVDAQI